MKKIWIVALSVLAVLGCAEQTAGLSVDGQSQRVIFNDSVLGGKIDIEQIDTDEVNGHARAVVMLTSKSSGNQNIQYRFYWYDDNGLEVNTKLSPWKQKIVRGYETISISEVSVNPNATNYRVQIRNAD